MERGARGMDSESDRTASFAEVFITPMLLVFLVPIIGLLGSWWTSGHEMVGHVSMSMLSLSLILLGSIALCLVFVSICVVAAGRSQRMQYHALRSGWILLRPVAVLQLLGQGAIVLMLLYAMPGLLAGVVFPKLTIAVAILLLLTAAASLKAAFAGSHEDHTLHGRRLDAASMGRFSERLNRMCRAMGQPLPNNIILGIDDNFFVTEEPIVIDGTSYRGRTLYVSIPLLRRMRVDEANAVLAHEMAHFSGDDTVHGRRIGAIMGQFNAQLRAMHGGMAMPVFRFLMLFRALFELSISKVSRERELRADRVAAQLVDRRSMAIALAKVATFCAFRARLESALFAAMRGLAEGELPNRINAGFERFAMTVDYAKDILGNHAPHPFDSHPTLRDRLGGIGVDTASISRRDIAEPPDATWIDAIPEADTIESALWSDYESGFKMAQEEILAYRLRPSTDAEADIVRRHFPDRLFEGDEGTVLAIDFASVSHSAWPSRVSFRDVRNISLNDGLSGRVIVFTVGVRGRLKTCEIPLRPFGKRQDEVAVTIGAYYERHLVSLDVAAHGRTIGPTKQVDPTLDGSLSTPLPAPAAGRKPSAAPGQSPSSPVSDLPPTLGAVQLDAAAGGPHPPVDLRHSAMPGVVHSPAETHAASQHVAMPAPDSQDDAPGHLEPGIINGRYAIADDEGETWPVGSMVRGRDRRTGEAVLLARTGTDGAADPVVTAIQQVAHLRIPGVIIPQRVLRAKTYRAREGDESLRVGEHLLVLPDSGTLSLLDARPRGRSGVTDALRLLRPLSDILDGCAAAGIDLRDLRFDHIRVDGERRIRLFLVTPWLRHPQNASSDHLLDPGHARTGQPATMTAVLAAILLAEPGDASLHACNSGLHRMIPSAMPGVNRLLADQLASRGGSPHATADAFLDALQMSDQARPSDHLSDGQINALRQQHGLDDAGIMSVIDEVHRRRSPPNRDAGTTIIIQAEIDRVLADRVRRKTEDAIAERLLRVRRLASSAALVGSLAAVLWWWFSNDGPKPQFVSAVEGSPGILARGTFTRDRQHSGTFPSRCYTHIPASSESASFYGELQGLGGGRLASIEVVDQDNRPIGSYAFRINAPTGWLYVSFPVPPSTISTHLTGRILVDGIPAYTVTTPVRHAWSDGLFGITIVLMLVWSAAYGSIWAAHRFMPRRSSAR